MSLALNHADILVKGHFNPYIITPEWLVRWQIISAERDVGVVFGALTHGVTFRADSFQWEVDFDHLSIASDKGDDCGALANKVLATLPHTPVRAVGHNFHYACSFEEWSGGLLPMLGGHAPGSFGDIGEEHQVRWTGTFSRQEARLEITVACGLGGVAVLFNFQRAIESAGADDAGRAAAGFLDDLAATKELMNTLLHAKAAS